MAELIIDLHIHSHYSRATSPQCHFEGLYYWGKLKGIDVIGTGDFTHPGWFAEMREKLEPAEGGLFRLKAEFANQIDEKLPVLVRDKPIRFVPTAEIATIYSKGGKVRRLHNLIVAPSFETVSAINARLERIGNLKADGRPILGLDSKELLRIVLEVDPRALYIPAHAWTPWFGVFGSKSGFDSLAEAFEELTPHVRAIETGLSSDPAMNWRIKELEPLAIISNSDAHSPQKLGREATVVDCELSYNDIISAYKTNDQRMVGTIEFFPQEGKYHFDGHRTCNVRLAPQETKAHSGICPVCGKPLVVGVEYRVDELATYPLGHEPARPKQVEYIIPLPEIIAELKKVKGVSSNAVAQECDLIYHKLGDEFTVLRKLPTERIREAGFDLLALAIDRMRRRDVVIEPGYDGIYGSIKVFKSPDERQATINQLQLL